MVAHRSLVLLLFGVAAFTSAQNFASNDACQPPFNNDGEENVDAAGVVQFDVSAEDVGFFLNDIEFIADLSGTFDLVSVAVYDRSVFDERRQRVADLVDFDESNTVLTTSGQVFRLGLTSTFEVLPETTAGVQVEFRNSSNFIIPLCRFSLAEDTELDNAAQIMNGDIVRRWGALSVSAGRAQTGAVIADDVVFHGGVCITTLGAGTLVVSTVNMTAEEVVPPQIDQALPGAMADATVTFDSSTFQVSFTVRYSGLSGAPTQVALFGPALRGQSVSQPQLTADQIGNGEASSGGEGYLINSLQATDLTMDGEWYVQINTEDFPDGELRGQIENFEMATRTISFPLTVDAVETGLDGDFSEVLTLSQQAEIVSGTPIGQLQPNAIATGTFEFESGDDLPDLNLMRYDIDFSGLSGNVTVAHFHRNARNTENAGILIVLKGIENNGDGSGTISGVQNRLSNDEIQSALDGLWYVNLHTAANPNGEVRAQVNRAQATVINSAASGFAELTLNSALNTVRYQIRFTDLSSGFEAAEIRGRAGVNEISEIVVDSSEALIEDISGGLSIGVASGSAQLTGGLTVDDIVSGDFYLLVRSAVNGETGELRGQIADGNVADVDVARPQSFTTQVPLSVDAEINALDENMVLDSLIDSNASGTARVEYVASSLPDSGVISWEIDFTDLFDGVDAGLLVAHFHGPAGITTTAGVRVTLAAAASPQQLLPSPLVGSMVITDAMAREAIAGLWYVNLHTPSNPATGELRGQIVPMVAPVQPNPPPPPPTIIAQRTNTIPLTREAEALGGTPLADNAGTGIGSAVVTLYDNGTLSWVISYTAPLSSAATIAHFHGPASAMETGGVQVVIVDQGEVFENPNIGSTDIALSNEQIVDLTNGLWYINIHTVNNPMGELRGQVVGFQEVQLEIDGEINPPQQTNPVDPDNGSTSNSISAFVLAVSITLGCVSLF